MAIPAHSSISPPTFPMNNLQLTNFKIFCDTFAIDLQGKNLLLYGENGSGKSSIYEAIELYYFHDLLIRQHVRPGMLSRDMAIKEFFSRYAYKGNEDINPDIEVKIDGNDIATASSDINVPTCAMLSYAMFSQPEDSLSFLDMASRLHIFRHLRHDDSFDLDYIQHCVDQVNEALDKHFHDTLRVGIDDTYGKLFLTNGNLRASESLHENFNEARINLVTLLLYLQIIRREYTADATTRPLLVLDDIVTSYDACNRTFLVEYLLNAFSDFHLIILTHNVGFNNLFQRIITDRKLTDQWKLSNLYSWDGKPHIYDYSDYTDIPEFQSSIANADIIHPDLAQELRKRFEAVIHELGKALLIGVTERPNYYIERLSQLREPLYLKLTKGRNASPKLQTSDDLVKSISSTLNCDTLDDTSKVARCIDLIQSYTSNETLGKISQLVRQFNFHEQLYIHRLSHGSYSLSNLSEKEFNSALTLLAELKKCVDIMKKQIGEM